MGPAGPAGGTGAGKAGMCGDDSNRFVDCGNGTITDTLTGLIWLKDAGCLGASGVTYSQALQLAGTLKNGMCGLTDGSATGDWNVPGVQEIKSLLIPPGEFTNPPCVPHLRGGSGAACYSLQPWATNIQATYWTINQSSLGTTTYSAAFFANTNDGTFGVDDKSLFQGQISGPSVWAVRGIMKQTCGSFPTC